MIALRKREKAARLRRIVNQHAEKFAFILNKINKLFKYEK